jgi:adenylosuccinate synthase
MTNHNHRAERADRVGDEFGIVLGSPRRIGNRSGAETRKVNRDRVEATKDRNEVGTGATPAVQGDNARGKLTDSLGEHPTVSERLDSHYSSAGPLLSVAR